MAAPYKKILILRGGAVGDFVLTLPALTAVRREWPEAHIELAANTAVGPLALAGGLVDQISSLDNADFARLFAAEAQLPTDLTARLQSFDLILSYLNDPDGALKRNLLNAGARRLVCGSPLVTTGHAIDALLRPLEELAIRADPQECAGLHLAGQRVEQGRKRMAEFGESVVAIHPGSGSPKKNWPIDHFIELAERLMTQTGFAPVLTLGEADEAIARELAADVTGIPVLPPCSLVELAQCLSACVGYVGNDSGITHLAAALRIPVVALFGPTDPGVWAPRGPNVKVIHAPEELANIAVNDVYVSLVQGVPHA